MTIQIEREAFGVWFKATRGNEPDDNNLITQFMLDAWLARSAQPSAPALPVGAIEAAIRALDQQLPSLRHYIRLTSNNEAYADARTQERNLVTHIASLRAILPTQGDKA